MFVPCLKQNMQTFQEAYQNPQETERLILSRLQGIGSLDIPTALEHIVQFSTDFWTQLETRQIQLPENMCHAFAQKQENIPDANYVIRMIQKENWQVTESFLTNSCFDFSPDIYACLFRFPPDVIHRLVLHFLEKGILPQPKQIKALLISPCSLETLKACLQKTLPKWFSAEEKALLLTGASLCTAPSEAVWLLHHDYQMQPIEGTFEELFWALSTMESEEVIVPFTNVLVALIKENPNPALYNCQILNLALFHRVPKEIIGLILERMTGESPNVLSHMLARGIGLQQLLGELPNDADSLARRIYDGQIPDDLGDELSDEEFDLLLFSGLSWEQAESYLVEEPEVSYLTPCIAFRRECPDHILLLINDLLFGLNSYT